MTTQQTVITAIKKVLDKGDIECPGFPPLAEGQPTLFFFVLFVSFVVEVFFLKRSF
jgi:hypothetical protein